MVVPWVGRPAATRRLEAGVGVGTLLLLTAYVRCVDPGAPGHYPSCPVHSLTGLLCPGCGSLRAIHALTTGDVATALHDNALSILTLPVALVLGVRVALVGAPARQLPRRVGWVVLASLALWTVARNLPWPPFTLMAP